MIVTGTYRNGKIELPSNLRLKDESFTVTVEIPDRQVLAQHTDENDPADTLMRDLDTIRGSSQSLSDDGVSDQDKFAAAVTKEHKYRG